MNILSQNDQCKIYERCLVMKYEKTTYVGGICFCFGSLIPSKNEANSILSTEEKIFFDKLHFEKRKIHYLMGRYAAKRAVSLITNENIKDINISYGVFCNPIISSNSGGIERLEVSISHSDDICTAITFPSAHPMAIDIERVVSNRALKIRGELTAIEIKLLSKHFKITEEALAYTIAWTIKESLSKALKTGLMTPFILYEISSIAINGQIITSYFKHFEQYKTMSFLLNEYVCSVTLPKKTECEFNVLKINKRMSLC